MNQHKSLACGVPAKKAAGYASGGRVVVGTPARKTGVGNTPLEQIKRGNGLPGMKRGGRVD